MSETLRRGAVAILGATALALAVVPSLPPVTEQNTDQSAIICIRGLLGNQCLRGLHVPLWTWRDTGNFQVPLWSP